MNLTTPELKDDSVVTIETKHAAGSGKAYLAWQAGDRFGGIFLSRDEQSVNIVLDNMVRVNDLHKPFTGRDGNTYFKTIPNCSTRLNLQADESIATGLTETGVPVIRYQRRFGGIRQFGTSDRIKQDWSRAVMVNSDSRDEQGNRIRLTDVEVIVPFRSLNFDGAQLLAKLKELNPPTEQVDTATEEAV